MQTALYSFTACSAFTVQQHAIAFNKINSFDVRVGRPSSSLRMAEFYASTQTELADGNDVEFTQGCTVKIKKGMKAYQVPRKGAGSFADDNSFVPLDWDTEGGVPRIERCLVMPEGMRGVVSRVYDLDEFDASQPIVAKFVADDAAGGDYASPVTFFMHFDTHELEVVV